MLVKNFEVQFTPNWFLDPFQLCYFGVHMFSKINAHVDSFIDEYTCTVISDTGWLHKIPPKQESLLDNNLYSAVTLEVLYRRVTTVKFELEHP